jgi:methionine salvage enolase-phosphatase E1
MENNTNHTTIPATTIVQYVEDKLTPSQQQEVEQAMQADAFLNDAVEGLQQIENTTTITASVQQLNNHLQQQLQQTKKKKRKQQWWQLNAINAAIAVAVIVLLCYSVYYFVYMKK